MKSFDPFFFLHVMFVSSIKFYSRRTLLLPNNNYVPIDSNLAHPFPRAKPGTLHLHEKREIDWGGKLKPHFSVE